MKNILFLAVMLVGLCMLNSVNAQVTQAFTVTNKTGSTVTAVSISQNDANSWSQNLISSAKIANGESFEFKQTVDKNNCTYDVKFTAEDGKDYYLQDINLCTATAVTLLMPPVDKTDKKLDDKLKK